MSVADGAIEIDTVPAGPNHATQALSGKYSSFETNSRNPQKTCIEALPTCMSWASCLSILLGGGSLTCSLRTCCTLTASSDG